MLSLNVLNTWPIAWEQILRHSVPQDDAELNENVRSEP
jgi:hypothetical protein